MTIWVSILIPLGLILVLRRNRQIALKENENVLSKTTGYICHRHWIKNFSQIFVRNILFSTCSSRFFRKTVPHIVNSLDNMRFYPQNYFVKSCLSGHFLNENVLSPLKIVFCFRSQCEGIIHFQNQKSFIYVLTGFEKRYTLQNFSFCYSFFHWQLRCTHSRWLKNKR